MTGAGENWLSDGIDDRGADFVLWVPGVDYMAGVAGRARGCGPAKPGVARCRVRAVGGAGGRLDG